MRSSPVRNESGFTFAELAFGMLILVIGAVVLINHLSVNYQTTSTERDRVFAYTKAQAILSEIQGYVDRGLIDAAVDLDVLDDGIVNKAPLTITKDGLGALVAPDHISSGNFQRAGQWVWSRRITVQPFVGLNNRNVRYVTVRVFRKDRAGTDRPMADLSAVINSAGSAFPTTQVFDLYLFAIENIPGWWVFMDSIKPFVESMITDLETRNPGLQFRTHWITKASFGRNQSYRPYTNDTNDSHAVIPDVYHYPGRMPTGNASSYYYVPDNIRGRINVDGIERNGLSDDPTTGTNPHPYALADFFNHSMRYPDELALWRARVDAIELREQQIEAAVAAGTPPPPELEDMSKEPTLRLFLEDLYSSPDKYRNALLINLHGELLAMPALRNYSDAAKDPVTYPDVRVVTHPEELRTKRNDTTDGNTDSLLLRMYAYANDPAYAGADRMADPMVVEIMGMDLTDTAGGNPTVLASGFDLSNLKGGVPIAGVSDYADNFYPAKHESDSSLVSGEMYYRAEFVSGFGIPQAFTRLYLYNTPLIAPRVNQTTPVAGAFGLDNSERAKLYQIPYIPCPIDAGPNFNTHLGSPGLGPKNTARWKLRIGPSGFSTVGPFVNDNGTPAVVPTDDVRLQIRTRIASNFTATGDTTWQNSGTMWPVPIQPDNLSTTYAWWADSKEDVPITERAQFNGDPRHMPYRDCFNAGDDFPNSYNWYHDNLTQTGETLSATDYPSIDHARLRDRWSGAMTADVPRYFELLREGITKSAVVYTTLTGYSYYYLGIGQDIGYDSANGYPSSIPTNLVPYGGTGNGFFDNIIGARRYARLSGSGSNYWWSQPWLGELYPDSHQAAWFDTSGGSVKGNLTAGTGTDQFYQVACSTAHGSSNRTAYGTGLANFIQRTAANGCTCFFNIGTSASTFHHVGSSGNGTLTTVGTELATNYNMTMPTAAPITRPFGLTWGGSTGEEWNFAPYSTKFSASLFRTYYTHAAGTGSGLVKLVNPAGTSASYVVVNGISNAVDNGTTFISKFAMLSLVHSFFEAGSTTNTLRIPQPARLEIESPTDITELNDPPSIAIQYSVDWTRWDGVAYSTSGTYTEDEALLEYVIMYSNDGGTTWRYVQDDALAEPGTRPASTTYIVADAGAGTETFSWDVSDDTTFPEGSYLLRIDCYRQSAAVHYSFHKTKIFIQR